MTSRVLVVFAVVAAVCWTATIRRLRDLVRDPSNRPLWYLTLTLAMLSLSITIQPLAQWLDRQLGVLDVGRVTANCLALVGATSAQGFMLLMDRTDDVAHRRVRREFATMLGAVLMIATIFAATPAPYSISDPYVVSHAYYSATPSPAAAPYQFVFVAFLAWTAWRCAVQAHRFAHVAARPMLRLGLHLITGGCALGLGYVAIKTTAGLLAAKRAPLAGTLDHLVFPSYLAAALTILIGATLPSWGPRLGLERLWNSVVAWRDCRRLRPLWDLIYEAAPQVALLPHPFQPTLRRVRMTVEILDGYAQLHAWTSARTADLARDRAGQTATSAKDCDAEAEAAIVVDAVRAKLAKQPPEPGPPATLPLHDGGSTEGPASANAQLVWLTRVAAALRSQHRGPDASQPKYLRR